MYDAEHLILDQKLSRPGSARHGGIIDDLARWGWCGISSTVRWDVAAPLAQAVTPPSTDVMLLSWPGSVALGASRKALSGR